jgi:hypothetical protein
MHTCVWKKKGFFSPFFWLSDQIYDATKKYKDIYILYGDAESDDMIGDLHKMGRLLTTKCYYCWHLNKRQIVKGGKHNKKL